MKKHIPLIIFNALYILGFAGYYIGIRNYEFLWYVAVLVFFAALVIGTLKRSQFDGIILWGLSVWGFLHMAGGGIRVGNDVLYGLHVLPITGAGDSYILRFDQIVHAYGFAVATLVVYHLLKPYLSQKVNWKVVYPLIAAAGMGLGAVNEIVEFIAVVVFPNTGVGGYYNTALDLVFNAIGAVCAIIFIHYRRRHEEAVGTTLSS